MFRKYGIYIIAGLITFLPSFFLSVAVLYALNYIIGGGLIYSDGLIDQLTVFLVWFLMTNRLYRRWHYMETSATDENGEENDCENESEKIVEADSQKIVE